MKNYSDPWQQARTVGFKKNLNASKPSEQPTTHSEEGIIGKTFRLGENIGLREIDAWEGTVTV